MGSADDIHGSVGEQKSILMVKFTKLKKTRGLLVNDYLFASTASSKTNYL
jgi:hypothetical protein